MMGIRSEAQDADNLRLAIECAKASLDPSTKVGGILLTRDGRQLPSYNHFLTMTDEQVQTATREERYADVLHAEERALLEVSMSDAQGAWYYGSEEPCGRCWKLLAHMGVERVIFRSTDIDRRERWGCDSEGAVIAQQAIKTRHPFAIVELFKV